jgi:hypothetical protein
LKTIHTRQLCHYFLLQWKKSHAERSGDLAGHMISPYLEITWLGNRLFTTFTTAMEARAVWHIDPSCWKNVSTLTGRR